MNYEQQYEALYAAMRAALDADLISDPIMPVTSSDTQTNTPASPPFVTYRQDIERTIGTMGGGNNKVMRSGWVVTARAYDIGDSLAVVSSIATALTDDAVDLDTDDGYTATDVTINGVQSLYEEEFKVYAVHLRFTWERSK